MKTLQRIIFLIAILTCAIQHTHAYEYFTIYFTDGTKSKAFYSTDVDSIRYSKLDVDSIEYADWQVQEIWTVDSVYRYPLALIDNLSFTDVDENKVAEDIAKVNFAVNPLYLQSTSSEELAEKLTELSNINSVEKVWTDNQSLFIKLKDYGIISYSYPPKPTSPLVQNSRKTVPKNKATDHSLQSPPQLSHKHVEVKNVCVVRQMVHDLEFKDAIEESDSMIAMCQKWGLNVDIKDNPSPEFFVNGIRGYDLVFLMTHGLYNGSHWLATSEEIYKQTFDKPLNEDSLCNVAKEFIKTKYYDNGYSPNDVNFSHLIENRNGARTLVCYTWISNQFISKHNTPKSNNIVVFNAACQSMKGNNPEMAEAFMKSGAVCYTGFTESNRIGPWTNSQLGERLLSGFSVYSAYQSLPDIFYQETFELPENSGTTVNPILILWPEKENKLTSICITHPETLPAEVTSNSEGTTIKFMGSIKVTDPGKVLVEGGGYGFQYSDSPDFSSYQVIVNDMLEVLDHDKNTLTLRFETGNIESLLNSTTTCYYRAFMNDGYSECYGETKSFSMGEPYAVLNGETLTFYYDSKKNEREGTVYEVEENYTSWESKPAWSDKFTTAVFDASFANYRPTSTAFWFYKCSTLKNIENIAHLNTSNVTDMRQMFSYCSSLTSLDLSSFNTSNVTDMYDMFGDCRSLTSLDVSSFNTSNVTDMCYMFSGCKSLTSLDLSSFDTSNVTQIVWMFSGCDSLTYLDFRNLNILESNGVDFPENIVFLDVRNIILPTNCWRLFRDKEKLRTLNLSNANSSNVTDMHEMFEGCSSLTSLDLSSFDTSNVTDMREMFSDCSSLTSLDLSSFDTSNVTDMYHMFGCCRSLTSLDLSSFNTSNVTDMKSMFSSCNSLTSLDLSSFNTSNVTDMRQMFSYCSSLTSLDLSSFNTSNVTDMFDMFGDCRSLTSLDLSSFNTSNVTNMQSMFDFCKSLTSLDVSSFNTSNVTDMSVMFSDCSSLTSLDLSSFDTSNVTNMHSMFSFCSSLQTIYGGNWGFISSFMFYNCANLRGGKGTHLGNNLYGYDANGNPLYYYCSDGGNAAHIDGGKDNPGLFTAK